jgi:FkbM family methyltransferase
VIPLARKFVAGTAIEPVARIWWRRLRVGAERGRNARDNALAVRIMARVLRRDSTWVDVGTSTGDLLWHVLRHAPRGRHFAFEPIPETAAIVRARFPSSVEVRALALSDATGEVEFQHVVTNPGYSGLRRREYPRAGEQVRTIRVPTARLDDVLPQALRVDAMKVDVEGAELQVFRGAVRTLSTHRPFVLFEHGRGAADCYGTTPEAVYDLLAGECGLCVSLPADWLEGRQPLDRAGFVAVFGTENCNFLAHPADALSHRGAR